MSSSWPQTRSWDTNGASPTLFLVSWGCRRSPLSALFTADRHVVPPAWQPHRLAVPTPCSTWGRGHAGDTVAQLCGAGSTRARVSTAAARGHLSTCRPCVPRSSRSLSPWGLDTVLGIGFFGHLGLSQNCLLTRISEHLESHREPPSRGHVRLSVCVHVAATSPRANVLAHVAPAQGQDCEGPGRRSPDPHPTPRRLPALPAAL